MPGIHLVNLVMKQLRLMLRNRTAMLAVMAAPLLLTYLFSLSVSTSDLHTQEQTGQRLTGFAVMFLWFAVIQGFRTLVEEQENGTIRRLRGTPVSFNHYLLSKTAAVYLFGCLNITVILGAAAWVLDIRTAAIGAEALIWAAYLLALTGIVLLFAPFVKNHQNFTIYGSVIMALTGILGGSFFPIGPNAPVWIRSISKCIPGYWAMDSLTGLAYRHATLGSRLLSASLLAATGAACIVLSLILVRHSMQPPSNHEQSHNEIIRKGA